jgi:hypothetical protein
VWRMQRCTHPHMREIASVYTVDSAMACVPPASNAGLCDVVLHVTCMSLSALSNVPRVLSFQCFFDCKLPRAYAFC